MCSFLGEKWGFKRHMLQYRRINYNDINKLCKSERYLFVTQGGGGIGGSGAVGTHHDGEQCDQGRRGS